MFDEEKLGGTLSGTSQTAAIGLAMCQAARTIGGRIEGEFDATGGNGTHARGGESRIELMREANTHAAAEHAVTLVVQPGVAIADTRNLMRDQPCNPHDPI